MKTEKINRQLLIYIYLKSHAIDMSICVFGIIIYPPRRKEYLTKPPVLGTRNFLGYLLKLKLCPTAEDTTHFGHRTQRF